MLAEPEQAACEGCCEEESAGRSTCQEQHVANDNEDACHWNELVRRPKSVKRCRQVERGEQAHRPIRPWKPPSRLLRASTKDE